MATVTDHRPLSRNGTVVEKLPAAGGAKARWTVANSPGAIVERSTVALRNSSASKGMSRDTSWSSSLTRVSTASTGFMSFLGVTTKQGPKSCFLNDKTTLGRWPLPKSCSVYERPLVTCTCSARPCGSAASEVGEYASWHMSFSSLRTVASSGVTATGGMRTPGGILRLSDTSKLKRPEFEIWSWRTILSFTCTCPKSTRVGAKDEISTNLPVASARCSVSWMA